MTSTTISTGEKIEFLKNPKGPMSPIVQHIYTVMARPKLRKLHKDTYSGLQGTVNSMHSEKSRQHNQAKKAQAIWDDPFRANSFRRVTT